MNANAASLTRSSQASEDFARALVEARRARRRLAAIPEAAAGFDAAAADATQFATAALIGPIGGWKVSQVGDQDGAFGAIFAEDMRPSPCALAQGPAHLSIEIEVAFRLGRDLPARADGRTLTRADVEDAIEAALPVFELLASRLPEGKPAPALARADRMGNQGLILGAPCADWREVVTRDLAVEMRIDGVAVLAQRGGHPSDDPLHPVVWLANALVARGRPLRAGEVVTTGAYGGGHPIAPGQRARGSVAGLGTLDCDYPA